MDAYISRLQCFLKAFLVQWTNTLPVTVCNPVGIRFLHSFYFFSLLHAIVSLLDPFFFVLV